MLRLAAFIHKSYSARMSQPKSAVDQIMRSEKCQANGSLPNCILVLKIIVVHNINYNSKFGPCNPHWPFRINITVDFY